MGGARPDLEYAPLEKDRTMTLIKKNPWIILVAAFSALIVVGIALS